MSLASIALIIVALPNVLIGLTVLLRNAKSITNLAFMAFAMFVALWAVGLALFSSVDNAGVVLVWSKVYYVAAACIAASLFIFSKYYQSDESPTTTRVLWYASLALSVSFLVISSDSFLISSISISESHRSANLNRSHYLLYTLMFITYFFASIRVLYRRINTSPPLKATHIRIVLTGVLLAGLFGMYFNLFLPWLGNYDLIWVGPQFSVLMVGFIAYGILKHRLFDIRSVIARSLAYTTSLGAIGLVFALVFYLIITNLFDRYPSTAETLLTTMLTLMFATLYQPFKSIFDKFTDRLFYHDKYETQDVLDRLSSILATELNLQIIVSKSSELIVKTLNPSSFRFVVFKDGESYVDQGFSHKHRAVIRPEVDTFSSTLISRDEASDKERGFLDLYDADVLLKLRTNEETVGAVLLGSKQSGTVYSKQDIDLLTISEKELAIAIQNSRYFEQIQEFNVKLQQEVEQATAQLRSSNEKLKALDEAKDEFVSMASHQLRTPLTSVKGYISMVLEEDAGKVKTEQRKLLEEAFASSQRMVYLIADLLNVSRLKTGKFIIEPTEVYLPDIVEQEVKQLTPTAKARQLKLTFNKPQRFPTVWLDETKIRQVIMNFIDNAIYYTKAKGQIEIQLIAKRDRIEYKVKDNGIGVPKAEQSKLFTKFFRANNARKARPDGTGLGLYMAQRVVSAQGGSVIFESKEGKGSTFGFAFPLKAVKQPPTKSDHPQSE